MISRQKDNRPLTWVFPDCWMSETWNFSVLSIGLQLNGSLNTLEFLGVNWFCLSAANVGIPPLSLGLLSIELGHVSISPSWIKQPPVIRKGRVQKKNISARIPFPCSWKVSDLLCTLPRYVRSFLQAANKLLGLELIATNTVLWNISLDLEFIWTVDRYTHI